MCVIFTEVSRLLQLVYSHSGASRDGLAALAPPCYNNNNNTDTTAETDIPFNLPPDGGEMSALSVMSVCGCQPVDPRVQSDPGEGRGDGVMDVWIRGGRDEDREQESS